LGISLGIESFFIIKRSPAYNPYGRFRAAGYRFHLHGIDRYNNYDKQVTESQLLQFTASDFFVFFLPQLLILRFAFAILSRAISISGRTS
jgi:hypothetical protein